MIKTLEKGYTKGGQQIGSNKIRKSQNKIKNTSSGRGNEAVKSEKRHNNGSGGGNVMGYYWC